MKSWDGLERSAAVPEKPRRFLVRRVLSATFVTLVILAGIDTIVPESKSWLYPHSWRSLSESSTANETKKPFDWSQIEPSNRLEFHACNDGFQCAKLSLPLDYFNGAYPNTTVSIAIAKLAARVPVDDTRYGGPIILNPGGPGGPGAWFALQLGKTLQGIVDSRSDPSNSSPDAKYYDIIGFDPRGIGMSEPLAKCMSDEPSSWSWELRENSEGILGSSNAALGRLWSMTHAFGSFCEKAMEDEEGPDIKEYMSTASVARDMLEITEKHAEHVAERRAQLSAHKTGKVLGSSDSGYRSGEVKLQYWGFSYGTFIGSTFASMFPDRIGRVVLDGVVSSYDYLNNLGNGSLTDSEKSMHSFYTYCHSAGPSGCELAAPNGTVVDIQQRFQSIVQSLYHAPFPLNTPSGPEILTWSDVKILLFAAVYHPRILFPFLATFLAALEAGGGSTLDTLIAANPFSHTYSCPVNDTTTPTPADYPSNPHPNVVAANAILCGDGHDQRSLSLPAFTHYWHAMDTAFPTAGSYWSMLRLRCAAWPLRPHYSFRGPFGAPQPRPRSRRTSHPLLFVSNTADPVTPLRSGRHMHSLFPGSSLVVVDGAGHTSLAVPNACSLAYIRRYFQTGAALPESEREHEREHGSTTLCVPVASPWSLNSTDPASPFYDPGLLGQGEEKVVVVQYEDDLEGEGLGLRAMGMRITELVGESGIFGFQHMVSSSVVQGLVKTARNVQRRYE